MQTEAGQNIETIIQRKEYERLAGDGLFMWGVGNAPALLINVLARIGRPIPVVFSLMKSRPRAVDATPELVLVWRRYVDRNGLERDLPPNAIVTSRGSKEGTKKRHYALMCRSDVPLRLSRGTGFDHRAYRNASETGAPVGASQVTALVKRVTAPSEHSDYEINLRAWLSESYWVKLADPVVMSSEQIRRLSEYGSLETDNWLPLAKEIRGESSHMGRDDQLRFFI